MNTSLAAGAAVVALVATVTPGPNNVLLTASGLTFGFRRTVPMMLGFVTGLLLLLLAVASGLGAAFERFPWLHPVLKFLGTAYLLTLAWKLWQASSMGSAAMNSPHGFFRSVAFQAINPKAWMMSVGAISAYTSPGQAYWPSVGWVVAAFAFMGFPSATLWTAFGGLIRSSLGDPRRAMWIGRAMAILTAASCLLIVL